MGRRNSFDDYEEEDREERRKGPGRPKGGHNADYEEKQQIKSIVELARQYTEEAVETLAEIMQDRYAHAGARVSAANGLLDRGWGKAPQTLNIGGVDDPKRLNDADLEASVRREIAGFITQLNSGTIESEDHGQGKPN